MVEARIKLDDYTSRVLDVIKGKFGLKNRSEALKRFSYEFGKEFVEPQPNEWVLKELDDTYDKHINKYGKKKMSQKELNKLLNL